MRRPSLTSLALLAATTLTATPSAAAPATALTTTDSRGGSQSIDWGPCSAQQHPGLVKAGAECGQLTVPLDYAAPHGRTIDIAVSRIRATAEPSQRRGILLANPGGPGGPGLDYPLALSPVLGDVAGRYDLIGFDPRFLGDSTPLGCTPPAGPPAPAAGNHRQLFDATVASARDMAQRCGRPRGNAALLPHATSRNVARDMDAIRAALREPALSYFGVSYGADLGAVYTQLFPRRADRIVLDSGTDPSLTQYELFQVTGPAAEAGLDDWAAWTAARHDTYGLGRTAPRVRATVEGLVTRAERQPITIGGHTADSGRLRLIMHQLVQYEESDPQLARIVRNLRDAVDGHPVEPDPVLAQWLTLLASPDADALFAIPSFTMCADGGWPAGGWPTGTNAYWRATQKSRATEPVFGPQANAVSACTFWPAEPGDTGTAIDNDVPVLILHATGDNNTPYAGGIALHRALGGSRLLTADIRSHGVYANSVSGNEPIPCADNAVNAYLAGGPLLPADRTCTP
ncbi:alpha/beta hydrolase [Streptomyces sp. NPDC004134]|uniref:alpha/beta hydrolase n=1 Tax=Streptomyces sp. NPDC004134 TaxID=3364691 RepID=UPI003697B40E